MFLFPLSLADFYERPQLSVRLGEHDPEEKRGKTNIIG